VLSIAVEDIPHGGLEIAEQMAPEWLGPLVGPQFFPSGEPVRLKLFLVRTEENVVARGEMTGRLKFVCSRCAEEAPFEVKHSFSHVFVARIVQSTSIDGEFRESDNLEFTFYDGKDIELEPLASEELVLALPHFPLCSEGCKGICQHCGKNLNEGPCDCHSDVVDPRWVRLREIKL